MKCRLFASSVLSGILIVGCSSSPQTNNTYRAPTPTVASDAEMNAANQRRLACLAKYSSELDDGSTDVNVIVRAVINSCRRERENFYNVSTRGRGPLNHNVAMNAVMEMDVEAATYYILSNRAGRR